MKIAIVTNFLYPDGLGGTELYCYQLANALVERGNEVYWFVPNFNKSATETGKRGNGFEVVKFAGIEEGKQITLAFTVNSFIKEMKARDIRVAHFHEFGGYEGISAALLAETRRSGIGTVVTLHLSNYVCQTGTLHYGGSEPCNGRIILNRCSSCSMFSKMTPSSSLNLLLTRAFTNIFRSEVIRRMPRIKRFIAGVSLKESFIGSVRNNADIVVSLTHWFRDVLMINGFDSKKIVYIPQVSPAVSQNIHREVRKDFIFIGRVNEEKGVDMLLGLAAKLKKEMPGTFIDIYGPHVSHKDAPGTYIANLNNFDNVRYKGVLAFEDVLPVMSKYKAVLLPSRVAEMAPLVIMEANKLEVPVIASAVPGSAELVSQYDCGLIFLYSSTADLYKKIKEIVNDHHRFNFKQPKENDFYHTARRYEEVYARCLP